MGNKGAKGSKKPSQNNPSHTEWPGVGQGSGSTAPSVKPKPEPPKLSDQDYAYLVGQTGQSKEQVKKIFDAFMENNPDGRLDRREFVNLYTKLRPEDPDKLDEISQFVFRAFDQDRSGFIDFNEFMIAYSLTSRGELKQKLEYAFLLYDSDRNGYLDKIELREVITGMLDLLGADQRTHNANQLSEECLKELDASRDGKVTKSEFIEGLMKNYSMRALLSPFN